MARPYSFAWGKLYLATVDLSTGSEGLPSRVRIAYRHLGALNDQNLPPAGFERLKTIRLRYSRASAADEEDATITLAPLTEQDAVIVAEAIVSLFDEVSSQRAEV